MRNAPFQEVEQGKQDGIGSQSSVELDPPVVGCQRVLCHLEQVHTPHCVLERFPQCGILCYEVVNAVSGQIRLCTGFLRV